MIYTFMRVYIYLMADVYTSKMVYTQSRPKAVYTQIWRYIPQCGTVVDLASVRKCGRYKGTFGTIPAP